MAGAKGAAFFRWVDWLAESKRLYHASKQLMRKWMHREVYQGLETWYSVYKIFKRRRALLERVGARWQNRTMSAAYNAWYGQMMYRRSLRRKQVKILLKWKNKTLAMAFTEWWGIVMAKRRASRKEGALFRKWQYARQNQAIAHWRTQTIIAATWRVAIRKAELMVERAMGKVERMVLLGSLLKGESREEALAEILEGLAENGTGLARGRADDEEGDDDDDDDDDDDNDGDEPSRLKKSKAADSHASKSAASKGSAKKANGAKGGAQWDALFE